MRMSGTNFEGLCCGEDVCLMRDSESQGGFGISNINNSFSAMALLGCGTRKCFEVEVLLQMLWMLSSLPASIHERSILPPPHPQWGRGVIEIRAISR